MNHQYYYLVSLLPALVFGHKTPLSSETFQHYCSTHLNQKDNDILRKITSDGTGNAPITPFYDAWQRWNHTLQKTLGHMRAAKMSPGGESRSFPAHGDREMQDIVQPILSAKNPLDAEQMLARVRWKRLDEMEFGIYFEFEKIISYGLKLKLLERLESFDPAKGGVKFNETLDALSLPAGPEPTDSL